MCQPNIMAHKSVKQLPHEQGQRLGEAAAAYRPEDPHGVQDLAKQP